jgi:hypothetical protein
LTLLATCFAFPATSPTRSVTLALSFCCAAAGFERDTDFDPAVDFDVEAFDRAVGFDCAAGFARDVVFAERLDALFVFGAEPLDDRLVGFLRGLLVDAGLRLAILSLFSVGNTPPSSELPGLVRSNPGHSLWCSHPEPQEER